MALDAPTRAASAMSPRAIRAISFDLDDTLWPIAPVLQRVDETFDAWLREHCPQVAAAWPIPALRELRVQVAHEHPELGHDLGALRRLTLQRAFTPFGLADDWIDAAYAIFARVRNQVQCYSDVEPALTALSQRYPLISISNGNADLTRIGMDRHFRFSVSAGEMGVAKPDAAIFRHACARLQLNPSQVLHVGDDPVLDVAAARAAGLRSAWLNRDCRPWSESGQPDLEVADLDVLTRWLAANDD